VNDSIRIKEDRLIRKMRTLMSYLDEPKTFYRINGVLRPKLKRQLYSVVESAAELKEQGE
jgi:hypothetical protein